MNAEAPINTDVKPRWRRRFALSLRRTRIMPLIEIATLVALVAVVTISYFIVAGKDSADELLTPPLVAALLVANLAPAMALMVLAARRVAKRRAARNQIGGRGRLHVRLVALFSVIASVPTLMVVVFASLLFQSGLDLWFSERGRTVLENANLIAREYRQSQLQDVDLDIRAMGADIVRWINENGFDDPLFDDYLLYQTGGRKMDEAALLTINSEGRFQVQSGVQLSDTPFEERFAPAALLRLKAGETLITDRTGDRIEDVIRLDPVGKVYLYTARNVNPRFWGLASETRSAASDYRATLERSRTLQFRFNAALLVVSLLIIAISIWIALTLADRLVRPVGQLVDAARRVTAGDLSTRVPTSRVKDEVASLGSAFNRMTRRLEEQTGALVSANNQLESRRTFIEAVLSGVTAGIISVGHDRQVRLINSSAEALLQTGNKSAIGQKLKGLAPELDRFLDGEEREEIIQFASGGEPRTLAVKRVKVDGGHVLTFDDITEQLLDQRRAAWSDVARRIAHEIKNPLTPIQLAAERLQRRYGDEVKSDPSTFERLTATIVRQVSDLRRMVDEFSSFARMPKPVFREEAIADVAHQALFLHEVAHPDIAFTLDAPEPSPMLVCDRRQLGQALTNIVKNGVEAIQQKREEGLATGEEGIAITIRESERQLCIEIADSGVGLPPDRGRLTEPYMTTRVKGTGLGLAIVKKIVEEHFGSMEFEDAPHGGTLVRLMFDAETLGRLWEEGADQSEDSVVNG